MDANEEVTNIGNNIPRNLKSKIGLPQIVVGGGGGGGGGSH